MKISETEAFDMYLHSGLFMIIPFKGPFNSYITKLQNQGYIIVKDSEC